MAYVDGFLVPVPKDKLDAYMAIAEAASKVWIDHGALDYKECVLDDDNIHMMRSFHDAAALQEGETAVFAYIVYHSREDRDAINAKVMEDPRIVDHCKDMPFDVKRMAYAGFKGVVEAKKS